MAEAKVTFNQNVKFNQDRFRKGEPVAVKEDEYNLLVKSGVINAIDGIEWMKQEEGVDLFTLSKEELDKINKPIITNFLEKEGIEYKSSDTKDELIELIVGE